VQLREAIEDLHAREDNAWLEKFVDFYLSVRRTCDPGESCALQSLTPEVARADRDTKAAFEAELHRIVEAVAEGLSNGTLPARRKTAWAILSILSGGVSIARSAADPKTGSQIAAAIKGAILALTDGR
jgi:TetR/AcrR family transcriptional repressor of nem operon